MKAQTREKGILIQELNRLTARGPAEHHERKTKRASDVPSALPRGLTLAEDPSASPTPHNMARGNWTNEVLDTDTQSTHIPFESISPFHYNSWVSLNSPVSPSCPLPINDKYDSGSSLPLTPISPLSMPRSTLLDPCIATPVSQCDQAPRHFARSITTNDRHPLLRVQRAPQQPFPPLGLPVSVPPPFEAPPEVLLPEATQIKADAPQVGTPAAAACHMPVDGECERVAASRMSYVSIGVQTEMQVDSQQSRKEGLVTPITPTNTVKDASILRESSYSFFTSLGDQLIS